MDDELQFLSICDACGRETEHEVIDCEDCGLVVCGDCLIGHECALIVYEPNDG